MLPVRCMRPAIVAVAILAAALALVASGCGSAQPEPEPAVDALALDELAVDEPAAPEHAADERVADESASVTFSEHVAPILYQHCVECHRPASYGPFPLLEYTDARRRAGLIADLTESRFMPPWPADPTFSDLQHARWLEDEEIALLRQWADAGAPEGDPGNLPAAPDFQTGWARGEPDIVLTLPEAYPVPAGGDDILRCFALEIPELDGPHWITGLEIVYSSPQIVHHSNLFLSHSGHLAALQDADPEPGFPHQMEGLGALLGGRIMTTSFTHIVEHSGIPVQTPAWVILNHHFSPVGKPLEEQTRVGLYLSSEPPQRHVVASPIPPASGAYSNMRIPAGESAHTMEEVFETPVDSHLVSLLPHMHYVGKSVRAVAVTPDGETHPLLYIPDWGFEWQTQYMLSEELFLPAGSRIHATFTYDNSAQNPRNPNDPPETVYFGNESSDEMALLVAGFIVETLEKREQFEAHNGAYQERAFMTMDLELFKETAARSVEFRHMPEDVREGIFAQLEAEYLEQRAAWEARNNP